MRTGRTLTIQTHSEDETIAHACSLAKALAPGDVVSLEGELGAGKTRFVRGLAEGLGHDPTLVSSPTFVLVNHYESEGATPLIHVDAYRLSEGDDLESLGWDRIMDGAAVVAVEWGERIGSVLPEDRLRVRIEHGTSGESRKLTIDLPENRDIDLR